MLPKLQQSSIANSLRRDNLASLIQCKSISTQVKINSKIYLANKTINPTNHGKISMPPKIHTRPSETSPKNISPKKNSKKLHTNPCMNSLSRDLWQKILKEVVLEDALQALSKKRRNSKNQCQNQVHSRKDKSPLLNLEDTMIEEICLSEWIIKILNPN
jgi:hypothetical protein